MLLRHAGFHKLCQARDLLRLPPQEDPPTVAMVAALVGLSPAHFSRQFEALFGTTPHQYRVQARIDRARELLALGDHSVTEVCFAIGCASLGSFSTLFSRHVGESPSRYRRRIRVTASVPDAASQLLYPGCLELFLQLPAESSFREAPAPLLRADCVLHA